MNEKMNGGISTMRGIFCRLSFQKGGITAETIAAQGFDGGIFSVDTRHEKALKSYDFKAFQFVKEPLSSFVENRGSLINWGAACVSADGSCFDPRPIRHTTRPRLRPHPRTSPGSPPKGPLGCHSRPECCRCGRCCQMGRRAVPGVGRSRGGQWAGRDR